MREREGEKTTRSNQTAFTGSYRTSRKSAVTNANIIQWQRERLYQRLKNYNCKQILNV